jgi:hypothetical protein
MADKTSGENRIILVAHVTDLMGLKATSTSVDESWSNACSEGGNNGGCSHLCLATPKGKT